jgi:hypothetical protein
VKSRPVPTSGSHEFNVDPWTLLSVATGHRLRRIIEDLHMFHPRRCIFTLDDRPGATNQLARDVRFFRAPERMGIHIAASPNKKKKAVLHECQPVQTLLFLRRTA